MNSLMTILSIALLCSCAAAGPPSPPDDGLPGDTCDTDDDCRTGAECENAWCRDDGTCRRGTPTGFACGTHGMCVENNCIEL